MVLVDGTVVAAAVVVDGRSQCRQQKQLFEGAADALESVLLGSRGTWAFVEEGKIVLEERMPRVQVHLPMYPAPVV